MRKIILSLIFVSFSIISFCQNWAPIGATWHYENTQLSIPPSVYTGFTKVESIKDTNILGLNCRLLIETVDNTLLGDSLYMYSDINNKVFYYSIDSARFCMLYDFNAIPGDSFALDCYNISGSPLIVHIDSISQININGETRKTQYYRASSLSYEFTGMVIENIGHLTHMFPTPEDYTKGPLRCYQDDSLGLYMTGSTPCDFITGIDLVDNKSNRITVFPIPSSNKIHITSDIQFSNLNLIDIKGRRIKKFGRNERVLDVSTIEKGIYFIRAETDKGTITKKIIIN